jgi:predicted outer membrane repeat protein
MPAALVTLNHSQVTGNTASQAGGGIASATFDPSSVARLTLNNSTVTGNQQTLGPQDNNALGGGGIVNVLGTVTLNSSQVNTNTAQGFVGGGIANGDYFSFSGTTVC